jgi:hypothetical protein
MVTDYYLNMFSDYFIAQISSGHTVPTSRLVAYMSVDNNEISINSSVKDVTAKHHIFRENQERILVLKFNHIECDFNLYKCGLTSLIGSPKYVGHNFRCTLNLFHNLIDGPTEVGGTYNANSNPLTSLEGLPIKVYEFKCTWNKDLPLLRLLKMKSQSIKLDGGFAPSAIIEECRDDIEFNGFYFKASDMELPTKIDRRRI